MNELIKIEKHETLINAVCARELHERLEINALFANWIKVQIERADLTQDVDFVKFNKKGKSDSKPLTQYALTIDAAKNIAMLSQTQKGKEVRAYFIECEKKLLDSTQPTIADPELAAMVVMLTKLDRVRTEQAKQNELLVKHQDQLDELKAKSITSPDKYYTVAGYASLRGINLDVKTAAALGKRAVRLSEEMLFDVHKAHSEIFGTVNTYHVDVLCILFDKIK